MHLHKLFIALFRLLRIMVDSDDEYLMELGKAISRKRRSMELTQSDLAYRIGMEVPNLSVIENGRSNPQILTLVKIASALDCELRELIPDITNHSRFIDSPARYTPRKNKSRED
jgi:transcriptional regulator with XRE-family HTH domain